MKPIVGLSQYLCPVLEELDPNANLLRQLRTDTEKAQEKPSEASKTLLAKLVVHGQHDKVVPILRFSNYDPPHFVIPNRGHADVCKPSKEDLSENSQKLTIAGFERWFHQVIPVSPQPKNRRLR
ncbi:MAG: hypothetical protein KME05_23695 [Gloeocapsa sp. UFS-A4-WI-NPMV-4B04]|nr:hypothetical protein [Gloeocapsa sp. UFS-A4-WI-NPMV-4B04]